MELKGRVAVVTGGGMGIGQAIAFTLAQEGAYVSILDINVKAANQVASQIEEKGGSVLVCEADVTEPSDVDRSINQTLAQFGRVDILINNAGTTHPSVSILDLELEWFDKVVNLDLKGVYICSKRVGKEMVDQRSGVVINIASVAGMTSFPLPVYGPVKSAVIMLTQVLARDWARHGVRVNAIAPGYVLTPLLQDLIDKGLRSPDTLLNYIPMKEFVMPSDIANAAVFLCSDRARYITGVTLPVDAGFLSAGGWRAFGYD